jgi:hypothetical protein
VIVRVVSLYPLLIEILFRAGNCTNMQVPQLIPQIHTGSDILQRLKANGKTLKVNGVMNGVLKVNGDMNGNLRVKSCR